MSAKQTAKQCHTNSAKETLRLFLSGIFIKGAFVEKFLIPNMSTCIYRHGKHLMMLKSDKEKRQFWHDYGRKQILHCT